MSRFIKYYLEEIEKYGGIRNYVTAKSIEKKPFLNRIKKYAKDKYVIEAGCGSAANSIFLSNEGFHVTCVDKDPDMIEFAKQNFKSFKKKPKFINSDIRNLNKLKSNFDVSFSHGVLEHYRDQKIIELINSQLAIAKFVLISVPSNFFKSSQAINGDERFLDKKHWINLIQKTNGKLIESFGYFYDSNELKIRLLKLLSILTLNKLPKTKPYFGFVMGRR